MGWNRFSEKLEQGVRWLLPSPFAIALILTLFVAVMAWIWAPHPKAAAPSFFLDILMWWEAGLWNSNLLAFLVQMALILVLGHILALSPPVARLINAVTPYCSTTPRAVVAISLLTMTVGLLNWGLGLVFGAIFARKVAEAASLKKQPMHYGLIGAAGYSGMLVWHGGISGSAPLKAAETGHLAQLMGSVATHIPANVPLTETIFSPMNGLATLLMLGLIPLVLYRLALVAPQKLLDLKIVEAPPAPLKETGAAQFDNGWGLSKIIAALILTTAAIKPFFQNNSSFLQTLTPDFVNFILLGLGLLLHKNLRSFSAALDEAIGGIAGILIQFPLYFGIIAIVRESGLMGSWAQYFSEIATVTTFPVFTFFSAALINLFIPSGGGQWSVQGPVLIQTAQELGVPLGKCIMALAYGDQLTNMLQPFWALPLLGITGLKAKEVLPYTILMLLAGLLVFVCVLMVF